MARNCIRAVRLWVFLSGATEEVRSESIPSSMIAAHGWKLSRKPAFKDEGRLDPINMESRSSGFDQKLSNGTEGGAYG